MGSLDQLVTDLRRFRARGEVAKALRARIREPLPAVRRAIKRRAVTTLPAGGGLNVWVSRTRITAVVKLSGRDAAIRLRGGRKSLHGVSDIRRIDAGRVRHPSWGRRGRGEWHTQRVMAGFFTGPAAEVDQWRTAIVEAIDDALDTIRRG